MNNFIAKYIEFVRANGIQAEYRITQDDGIQIPGSDRSTYVVWTNHNGSRLQQCVDVLEEYANSKGNGNIDHALNEVQFLFGRSLTFVVRWEEFVDPPKSTPGPAGPVGALIPPATVAEMAQFGKVTVGRNYHRVEAGNVFEGQLVTVNAKKYRAVIPVGMFGPWWMEL